MTKRYTQILGDVYNQPWAILPGKLESICGVIEARLAGAAPLSEAELNKMAAANAAPAHQPGQGIAVIPLFGTLHHHGSIMSQYSGGTSTVSFSEAVRQAADDSSVGTIVIHANGPGGTVHGCQECAEDVYEARSKKRVITSVDARAASATYWIASAADEMYVTPSGEVGSIGVYMAHRDISKAEEDEGVKTTLIAIPSGKVLGNPFEPLPDEYLEKMNQENRVYYDAFVSAVAKHRNVSVETVVETFGGGGMVLAQKAVALGMADGIKTFRQVIADIQSGAMSARSSRSRQRQIQLAKME